MTKTERQLRIERRKLRTVLTFRQFKLHHEQCFDCPFKVYAYQCIGESEDGKKKLYAEESICSVCRIGEELRQIGEQLESL